MRKKLLSLSLIFVFAAYALWEHQKDSTIFYTVSVTPTETRKVVPAPSSTNSVSTSVILSPKQSVKLIAKQKQSQPTAGLYRNGEYTGLSADAYYGYVQVKATVENGKIAYVDFLDYPQDRNTSRFINSQAMPILQSEAIQSQSAKVNIVSGATDTSMAFRQSLGSALAQAVS